MGCTVPICEKEVGVALYVSEREVGIALYLSEWEVQVCTRPEWCKVQCSLAVDGLYW